MKNLEKNNYVTFIDEAPDGVDLSKLGKKEKEVSLEELLSDEALHKNYLEDEDLEKLALEFILDRFGKWLKKTHTKSSVTAYQGYVSTLLKAYGITESINRMKVRRILEELSDSLSDLENARPITNKNILKVLDSKDPKDYKKILNNLKSGWWAFIEFLFKNGVVDNSYKEKTFSNKEIIYNKPHLRVRRGYDPDCDFVRYDANIPDSDKVPGLCQALECQYVKICKFACSLFDDGKVEINRIPVILKKRMPRPCVYKLDGKDVATIIDNIYRIYRENRNVSIKDEVRNIHENPYVVLNICGRYIKGDSKNDNRPYIEIYYECFNENNFDTYLAAVTQTLAHEYMHHIHAISMINNTYDDKVSESLAEFFSFLYIIKHPLIDADGFNHSNIVAVNSFDFWNKYFDTSIPYPYALYYAFDSHRRSLFPISFDDYVRKYSIEKFYHVFRESLIDAKRALRILVD